MAKKQTEVKVNEQIRARMVRLISVDGTQMGIVPLQEALRVARDEGLDLVEVSPKSDPPVCRIMDFGKFKYQASKKIQEARKKSKAFQVKEVKLRPNTEEHDLAFKVRNILKFLDKKHRVKVTVMFRGREMAYMETGYGLLERVAEEVAEKGTVELGPKQDARNTVSMILVPKS